MKRATALVSVHLQDLDISIHALVKRATISPCSRSIRTVYFNPRPREEGDLHRCADVCRCIGISIHALVKRATIGNDRYHVEATDFNPRPREEGDSFKTINYRKNFHFNPRPREEGDFCGAVLTILDFPISIHALVKRATGVK